MKTKAHERLKQLRELSDQPLIAQMRRDESDVVRHEAAFILGERKRENKLKLVTEAFESLCLSCFLDGSVLVRHEAALALTAYDGSKAVLEMMLRDPSKEVRDSALYALEEISCQ